jgi:hypothetical protein
MGMAFEGPPWIHPDLPPAGQGVIRENVKMGRKTKQKRTIRVKRMFEPDRLSNVNLQSAYEQLIPPQHYWVGPIAQRTDKPAEGLALRAEIMG